MYVCVHAYTYVYVCVVVFVFDVVESIYLIKHIINNNNYIMCIEQYISHVHIDNITMRNEHRC